MRVRWFAGALVPPVLWCTGALSAAQQQPVFRTNADLVTVPVSVRASGTPVGGLKPEDFLVLDNGVRQKVESLSGESVGTDVTILVETGNTMKPYLGTLGDEIAKISAMVRPADRLEILGIGTYIDELLPLRKAADQLPLGKIQLSGSLTSVNDALVAALLREPDKERPHLVIAITDTVDSMSIADMATVRDVAKESGATLVIAWITMSLDPAGSVDPVTGWPRWLTTSERETRATGSSINPGVGTDSSVPGGGGPPVGNGRSVARARYWIPHYTPAAGRTIDKFDLMKEAAESTGGAMHPPGVFVDRTAAAIFDKVYNDHRHNYVLRYQPTGVARDGWHDITVTTPKYSSYELHARRGYLVEAKAPTTDKPAIALPPPLIDELVAAGEKADYTATGAVIRRNAGSRTLIDEFIKRGNVFPAAPRREFLVALQLAEAALPSTSVFLPAAGYGLLDHHRKLLKQVEGYDGFERYWIAAALALAQAPAKPVPSINQLLAQGLALFPDEPRFVLASAIFADQEWITGDITSASAPTRRSADVIRRFDAAIALEPTRAEASVRKAWFLNRMGHHAEALSVIESAKPDPQDALLRYWRELFRGKILDDLGRLDDAAAAFRAALAIAPNAQSARSALMAVLVRSGHLREAEQEAETIQTTPANTFDPWWIYWQADYRWFPTLFSRLADFAK